jgi:hypothetical protein
MFAKSGASMETNAHARALRWVDIYLPMKMEQTECSEVLAYKFQMPVNHPVKSIRHSECGEILK